MCFDVVTSLKAEVENRRTEVHSNYAEGANIVLSEFLSSLFAVR
jgi:hypothetical protein